jgi:hypothetical protein
MSASFRSLAVLSLVLAACGGPATPAPDATKAALRNPGCDQGLPVVLHGRLVDAAGPPLTAITRVTVLLYGQGGKDAPLARADFEGGGPLPESYALCADRAQVEAEEMPIALALVEMEDRSRHGTSGLIPLSDAQLPLQVDLFIFNRQLSQQGAR